MTDELLVGIGRSDGAREYGHVYASSAELDAALNRINALDLDWVEHPSPLEAVVGGAVTRPVWGWQGAGLFSPEQVRSLEQVVV